MEKKKYYLLAYRKQQQEPIPLYTIYWGFEEYKTMINYGVFLEKPMCHFLVIIFHIEKKNWKKRDNIAVFFCTTYT